MDPLDQFKSDGYAILAGMVPDATIRQLRGLQETLRRQIADRSANGIEVIRNVLESAPELVWPIVRNKGVVNFAERIMGPFVQLDSTVLVKLTESPERRGVVEWHRDRLGQVPYAYGYGSPLVIVGLVYLQDLDASLGPLRVIPGSHSMPVTMREEDRHSLCPQEELITLNAGDVIVLHHNLIHSGTYPSAARPRSFFGVAYSKSFIRQDDDFDQPNCRMLLRNARQRGDQRSLRLLGCDERVRERMNSGFLLPDEILWQAWFKEDGAIGSVAHYDLTQL